MNVVLQLGFAAEKAQDQLSQANEQLRVDVEKWHGAKNKEVCQLMRQFATNHMEYHQKVYTTTHWRPCYVWINVLRVVVTLLGKPLNFLWSNCELIVIDEQ